MTNVVVATCIAANDGENVVFDDFRVFADLDVLHKWATTYNMTVHSAAEAEDSGYENCKEGDWLYKCVSALTKRFV